MTTGREVGKRLLAAAVVAVVVLVVVAGVVQLLVASSAGGGASQPESLPEHPEYDAERLDPQRLPSEGKADPSGDVGTVLIDRSHTNRFDREDVAALSRAIDQAGGDVDYTGVTSGLRSGLEEADVLVIIDPQQSYGDRNVEAIEEFVDDGGRVLIVGEPNRKELSQSGFAIGLTTQRSQVTEVASPFGISFGTQYLYDMEHNDGNFKNVVATPNSRAGDSVEGIERVTMYTATTVEAYRGTVLLRTAKTAESGNEDPDRGFPVAVVSAGGDVMALGDKSFMNDQYNAVADNEVFIARIVEFMAGADHEPSERGNETATAEPPAAVRAGASG